MDESLFTTRQLTEYREWPDGRKGCLMYIPYPIDENDYYGGAVYLIDSPFRRLFKRIKCDSLCSSEITKLNDSNRIVAGFGALILSVLAHNKDWGDSRLDVQKLWDAYRVPPIMYETGMHVILYQCELWMKRQQNIYAEFLNEIGAYDRIHRSVKSAISRALVKVVYGDESELSGFYPHVKVEDRNAPEKNGQYASYYYGDESFRLNLDTDIQIFGFTARVINHALERYVGNAFIDANTFDESIFILYNNLMDVPDNLSFKDITFRWKAALRKSEQPKYMENDEKWVRHFLETEDEYMLASKKKQDMMVFDYMFRKELKYFDYENPIMQYFSIEQKEMIKAQVRDYFMMLLTKLKGSNYYAGRFKDLENKFGKIMIEHSSVEQHPSKFEFIRSNDPEQIKLIHTRIELSLNSPAKLRDILKQLAAEQKLALPEKAVDIFPYVQKMWPQCTINPHSFATTWARRK